MEATWSCLDDLPQPGVWCTWYQWWVERSSPQPFGECGNLGSWTKKQPSIRHLSWADWWPNQTCSLTGNQQWFSDGNCWTSCCHLCLRRANPQPWPAVQEPLWWDISCKLCHMHEQSLPWCHAQCRNQQCPCWHRVCIPFSPGFSRCWAALSFAVSQT